MVLTIGELLAKIEHAKGLTRSNGYTVTDATELEFVVMCECGNKHDHEVVSVEEDVYDMDQGMVIAFVIEEVK